MTIKSPTAYNPVLYKIGLVRLAHIAYKERKQMDLYSFALSALMVGFALVPLIVTAWINRTETSNSEPEYDYR